jgi:hypothetical protein
LLISWLDFFSKQYLHSKKQSKRILIINKTINRRQGQYKQKNKKFKILIWNYSKRDPSVNGFVYLIVIQQHSIFYLTTQLLLISYLDFSFKTSSPSNGQGNNFKEICYEWMNDYR